MNDSITNGSVTGAQGLRVLYVGGTGTISAACVRRSVQAGHRVTVLNRGSNSKKRRLPDGVRVVTADITDSAGVSAALAGEHYDAVANFLTFDKAAARETVRVFAPLTDQYLHISTASIYHKPISQVPLTESTWVQNDMVSYSTAKIEAEAVMTEALRDSGFPVTIVRPSHTYDEASPPFPGDWTVIDRLARGAEVVVSGDGTSLWTLTHADDFAQGFVGLLGNQRAIGEVFHITSDDVFTWDQLTTIMARALGTEANIVHIPSALISRGAPDWGWAELIAGDISHSALFDTSKIRRFVPGFAPSRTFEATAREMVRWRADNPELTRVDPEVDAILDRLVEGHAEAARVFDRLAGGR